jgi:hypothetical protein
MMGACSDGPTIQSTNDDTQKEHDMYPGPNDTDWQVAKFQHRELVAVGQHQQLVAGVLAAPTEAHRTPTAIRRQLGMLLVRTGQRLQGTQAFPREESSSAMPAELGAIA